MDLAELNRLERALFELAKPPLTGEKSRRWRWRGSGATNASTPERQAASREAAG